MTTITLEIGDLRFPGALFETQAAVSIAAQLPLEVQLTRWGEEYYGELGFRAGPFAGEKTEELGIGDLAYWEPGNALCLFFGPTPASRGEEPRAASPVHRIGTVTGDWAGLKRQGETVTGRLAALR
jgi:hypothetical protein